MIEADNKGSTKFHSPLPFIIQFRNLIFGRLNPGVFTQLTFFINIVIWAIFQLWSILSYFVLAHHELFASIKGIDILALVENRAVDLGYNPQFFLDDLITAYGISIFCWISIFVSLVLMWREKRIFIYFFLGGFLFYMFLSVFYLGYNYFIQDTTSFDKITLLTMFTASVMYFFLSRKLDKSDSNFFEVEAQ